MRLHYYPFLDIIPEDGEEIKPMAPITGITDNIRSGYLITSHGRILSTCKCAPMQKVITERKTSITIDGYLEIPLYTNDKKSKSYKVSRLVLAYFGDPVDDFSKYDANHIDYNRQNNHIDNLNWMSHGNNIKYSSDHYQKYTDQDIIDIHNRVIKNNENPEIVAKDYNTSVNSILDIARGRRSFSERFEKLGLKYKKKKQVLTDNEIYDIYNDFLRGISPQEIAEKYNICLTRARMIRDKKDRYGDILVGFPDINKDHIKNKFDKTNAIMIHKICASGKYTQDELCELFNITPLTVHDIKFCENAYEYLKTECGCIPPKKQLNRFNDERALAIYDMAASGMKSNEIAIKTGVCVSAIDNIKFCRGQYKFLIDKYGKEPVTRQRRHH